MVWGIDLKKNVPKGNENYLELVGSSALVNKDARVTGGEKNHQMNNKSPRV